MEHLSNHDPPHSDKYRENIPAYLAGMLDRQSCHALEEHLPVCEKCSLELQRQLSIWKEMPDRAPRNAPLDFWPGLKALLDEERLVAFPPTPSPWKVALSFAAGLIVGIGLWTVGSGGPAFSTAATDEFIAHESLFENLDPIPPESMAGRYLSLLSLEEVDPGGGS